MAVSPTFVLSPWDVALVVVATTMGVLLAYIPNPRWKAFLIGLPLPFTLANLALNSPIGASHVLGMAVLLLFMNLVRWLYKGLKAPIVLAVVVSALVYLALGLLLNRLVPKGPFAFWISLILVMAAGAVLVSVLPQRREPAHRSSLPVPAKIVALAAIIGVIVALKQVLGGFMTMFPMVSTVAAYEARHSLWTMGRQIPILIVEMAPMMAVMRLAQTLLHASILLSLAAGWLAFLAVMLPVTVVQMRRADVSLHSVKS